MATLYTCDGFRPICRKDDGTDSDEPAPIDIFAGRLARREFGRRGYCHNVRPDCRAIDGSFDVYEAFIGVTTGPGECSGHNVWLMVRVKTV